MIQKSRTKRLPYFTQSLLYDAEYKKSTYLEGEDQAWRLFLQMRKRKKQTISLLFRGIIMHR
ncbi:hypothetical protein BA70_19245 [Bacillus zhangzhouensis]|uniref:Uncharacterized protein n=1 Tax=Bacillus zhangzhouensis TaxID=1178540 RepID=A0A081LBU1_9BACI|nr:hypothetical protein BA70_19245 [Bacillus zhangzhouensis]